MPKFLTNIFGNKATPTKESAKEPSTAIAASISNGNLETDALPVDDDDSGSIHQSPSSNASPTASAEMTADAVRQFSDPNYNSMVEARRAHGNEGAVGGGELVQAPLANGVCVAQNSNTMNVHNAQQQVVMNFSNVSQLHFGSVYNINGSRKTSFAEESTPPSMAAAGTKSEKEGKAGGNTKCRKTTTVLAMMQSQEEPNHRLLETIATHLGEGWRSVMRELGHSDGQIEQAVIDHHMHGGMKEVIYQLLLKWVHNADDGEATVARITTLLWSMNHRECVQRMKVVWKSSR